MIVQSFKSVIWVGAVASAALGCYMVSLQVASERAALERVEARILVTKRDIRALDTELVTRGRVRQLERWNSDVLALAPPTEGQFLEGETQLAGLTRVDPVEPTPMILAVADKDEVADGEGKDAERPRPVLASYTRKPKSERTVAARTEERAATRKVAKADTPLVKKATPVKKASSPVKKASGPVKKAASPVKKAEAPAKKAAKPVAAKSERSAKTALNTAR